MDFSVRFFILVCDGLDQKGGKRMFFLSLSICSTELQLKKREKKNGEEKKVRERKN